MQGIYIECFSLALASSQQLLEFCSSVSVFPLKNRWAVLFISVGGALFISVAWMLTVPSVSADICSQVVSSTIKVNYFV